ncbi:MAG: hypothetical protein R2690_17350 [Acidimicrobiales bacterium]
MSARRSPDLRPALAVPWVGELLVRCAFDPPGSVVQCGVSGGGLTALAVLAVAAGCDVTIVHVDHGLRPDSHVDAAAVTALAERLDVPVRCVQVDVAPGANLEARPTRPARGVGPGRCWATPPTIRPRRCCWRCCAARGARPRRHATRPPAPAAGVATLRHGSCVRTVGIAPVRDPSNADPRHRRNRVRHEVLPLLDDVAGRDVVPLLARTAAAARAATDHLDAEAAMVDPTDAAALRAAPEVVAVLALRQWLRTADPTVTHPTRPPWHG